MKTLCRRPAQCVDAGFGPKTCRLCNAKRKPLQDPDELRRHHLLAARIALDAAAKTTGIAKLLKDLDDARVRFKDLQTTQSSLEDIFVDLVKERS